MSHLWFAKKTLSVAVGLTLASSVYAAEQEDSKLEEMAVWGTQVRASSLNLDEDAIASKQADHISDLLRTIPGVDVGGAHSLNQRITIRSMDDKDLRITIDGANQNTYMYHHMGNLQIHADILQSVDVEIGTNSVVNGGLGGSVRFETKTAEQLLKADQRFGARVQLGISDNAGSSVALSGYGKITDDVDFLLYHNAVARDNYRVGGGEILGADGLEVEGTDGEVRGLEGDVADTLAKIGWDINPSHRLELGYETYVDEGDYSYRPDMGLATDIAIADSLETPLVWPTKFTRDTLTLNYEASLDNTQLKVAVFDNQSGLERDESGFQDSTAFLFGVVPVASFAAYVSGDADNQGVNILAETLLSNHTLTYGAEYIAYDTAYRAAYIEDDAISTIDTSEENSETTSFFVQDRIAWGDFAVIPGVRYDKSELESQTVTGSFDDVSLALAGEWQVNDSVLLKLSNTQLFKSPEIGEVFTGAGLFDGANPDIESETGTNKEFSAAYSDAVLGADRFIAGFTYFETDIENYIYDYAGDAKDNIGDMAIDGYEIYVGYDVGALTTLLTLSSSESSLDANATYTEFDGARIDRQQGDTVSLNVDYELSNLDLVLHWDSLIVGSVDAGVDLDGASSDNAKDSYAVHNISARWTPENIEGMALTFGIDNVFDEFYASQSSRTGTSAHPVFGDLYLVDYEPGRNVKMTASYSF